MLFKLNQLHTSTQMLGYRFKHGCMDLGFRVRNFRSPTNEEYIALHNIESLVTPELKEYVRLLNMTLYILSVLNIDESKSEVVNKLIRFSQNESKSTHEFEYVGRLLDAQMTPPNLLKYLIDSGEISEHKQTLLTYADTRSKLNHFLPTHGEVNEKDL